MRESVYASFTSPESAAKAVGALLDHGVKAEDTSILVKDPESALRATPRGQDAHDVRVQAEEGITVTTPEDAASGAAKGAGLGLGLGAIATLAAVAIPGFGFVLGGGALATAIAGMAGASAAGAVAGAMTGYLKDQGVATEVVDAFATSFEDGGALVSVSVPTGDTPTATIVSVLYKYGGTIGTSEKNRTVVPQPTAPPHVPTR